MGVIDVYLMYCALKAHFSGNYDYHRLTEQLLILIKKIIKAKPKCAITLEICSNFFLIKNLIKSFKEYKIKNIEEIIIILESML